MRKTIVCVFAHPDDEAFGPGGTIAILAKQNDVYILCATKGEAGQDSRKDKETPIQEHRMNELKNSAKILGVKKVIFLNYIDGTLSNNLYHDLAKSITTQLKKLKPHMLLTYENRGISGHIDHITISLVTTYVFYELPFVKELYYYCLSEDQRNAMQGKYFIYRPPGYKKSEISKTIKTAAVWDTKLKAMRQHLSQAHDVQRILATIKNRPKEENFIIIKK
jgi:LmbE family N-acetylglucosaminyl deacetylase